MTRWIRHGLMATTVRGMLAGAALVAGLQMADERQNRRLDIAPHAIDLPTDARSLARGRYLYTMRGCADCHGADGVGRILVDQGALRIAPMPTGCA